MVTTSDGITFGFDATQLPPNDVILAVWAKGGDGGNLYDYRGEPGGGVTSDDGLHPPATNGGPLAGISHIFFCYGKGTPTGGATGSTTVTTPTTTPTTPTTTPSKPTTTPTTPTTTPTTPTSGTKGTTTTKHKPKKKKKKKHVKAKKISRPPRVSSGFTG
jgi:hypothetical protein